MWWIERLRGRVRRGVTPPSYGLLGKKLNYGVDYGNYMHQLGAEIGAAPSFSVLLRSPRALIAYALGQAYVTFFRLTGTPHSALPAAGTPIQDHCATSSRPIPPSLRSALSSRPSGAA